MKRYSISSVIRKIQIKTTMGYQYILFRKSEMKNLAMPNINKDVEQPECSYTASENTK